MRPFIFLLLILGAQIGRAQDSLKTNIPVHDPVMIRQDGVYYVFATGRGISMWSSKDMQNWKKEKPAFIAPPEWAVKAVDADARSIAQPQTWFTLASVPRTRPGSDSTTGNGAIEAPFIFKKFDYFYLFASYDYCCRGAKSTYKIRIGRSKSLTGPYLDKDGKAMTQGGGTLLLEGNAEWHGVGHNAVCTFDGVDYLVFHGYDAKDKGRSKLRMVRLNWKNDWPAVHLH